MDIRSQIMVAIKTTIQEFKVKMQHIQELKIEMQHIQEECIQESKLARQERYIMEEYYQERNARYDYEDDCDDWYMMLGS
jgi:hypothetical protein